MLPMTYFSASPSGGVMFAQRLRSDAGPGGIDGIVDTPRPGRRAAASRAHECGR